MPSPFAQAIDNFVGTVAAPGYTSGSGGPLPVAWLSGAPALTALGANRIYRVTAVANPETTSEVILGVFDCTGIASITGTTATLTGVTASTGYADTSLTAGTALRIRLCRKDWEEHSTAINAAETTVATHSTTLATLGTAATHAATDFLTPTGNGSGLTGITEGQVAGLLADLATLAASIAAKLSPNGNGSALTGITQGQVSGLTAALAALAPLASPPLTGTPTAPTAAGGTNTTQIATTAFVLANAGGGVVVGNAVTGGTHNTLLAEDGSGNVAAGPAWDGSHLGIGVSGPVSPLQIRTGSDHNFHISESTGGGVALAGVNDALTANTLFEIRGNPILLTTFSDVVIVASFVERVRLTSAGALTLNVLARFISQTPSSPVAIFQATTSQGTTVSFRDVNDIEFASIGGTGEIVTTQGVQCFDLTVSSGHLILGGATLQWPSSNAAGLLVNDGAGNLTWVSGVTGSYPTGGGNTLTFTNGILTSVS